MNRINIVFAGLILLSQWLNASEPTRTLESTKAPVRVRFEPPEYSFAVRNWPSYEVWSTALGKAPNRSFVELRIDPYRKEDDVASMSVSEVRSYLRDLGGKVSPAVSTVMVDGQSVVLHQVKTVEDTVLIGQMRFDQRAINFVLRSQSSQAFSRDRDRFLAWLRTIRLEKRL